MQNPLRRPHGEHATRRGNQAPPFHDPERGGRAHQGDEDVMSQGMRGHFVAMTGEFVGTVMSVCVSKRYFPRASLRVCD